jgi:2,3-bisphosphoglycerate-independent phosphoglycerate mutase
MAAKKHVLIIPDGAADRHRRQGLSPMAEAHQPFQDWLARNGLCGRMQTQYEDLPRGSIVAQLGMLGWDPRQYRCLSRSAWELLALGTVDLHRNDLVLRANLARTEGQRLVSYNAGFIRSQDAIPLIDRLNTHLRSQFPEIELYHNCDFRNSLVIRGIGIDPLALTGPEPHESEGLDLADGALLTGCGPAAQAAAARINRYVARAADLLAGTQANFLFPWSAGCPLRLPSFKANTGFQGRAAIIGCMDFLRGIARAADIDFYPVGNGRPDTDYAAKGAKLLQLLDDGYALVVCHINAPDEAAHMHDRNLKIHCLESIDRHIVGPAVDYFRPRMADLGGLLVAPDHYTNLLLDGPRADAHSTDPVPFVLWNGRDRQTAPAFHEDAVAAIHPAPPPISHLRLLDLLGVRTLAAQPHHPTAA